MMRSIVRRVVVSFKRYLPLVLGAFVFLAVVSVLWIFPAWRFEVITVLQKHLIAVIVLGLGLFTFMLWRLPKWQVSGVQDLKDRLDVENAARQTLAQIVGGVVLIAGLFFTWANLQIAQETAAKSQETATMNLELSREGQITDRFTKAIAQLGDTERLAVRLGGSMLWSGLPESQKKITGRLWKS